MSSSAYASRRFRRSSSRWPPTPGAKRLSIPPTAGRSRIPGLSGVTGSPERQIPPVFLALAADAGREAREYPADRRQIAHPRIERRDRLAAPQLVGHVNRRERHAGDAGAEIAQRKFDLCGMNLPPRLVDEFGDRAGARRRPLVAGLRCNRAVA